MRDKDLEKPIRNSLHCSESES